MNEPKLGSATGPAIGRPIGRDRSRRRRVALATSADWPELAPDDRTIAPALARVGVDAEIAVWTDAAVDWDSFDLILVRSCWDYHDDLARWLAWVAARDSARTGSGAGGGSWRSPTRPGGRASTLCNPPAVLMWNARKTYLAALEARGIPTVPTTWIDTSSLASWRDLAAAVVATPWDDIVLKPAVSAGALGTVHGARAAIASSEATLGALWPELVRRGPVLVQPYLPEIVTDGEWSLIFFDERFSHAVVKRPARGDFRVQERHGGSTVATTPPSNLVRAAERTLGAAASLVVASANVSPAGSSGDAHAETETRAEADRPWLYARVDIVVSRGTPLLVELEAIEPALFLSTTAAGGAGPRAAETLAAAIAARIGGADD